jgi:hypothetical protein
MAGLDQVRGPHWSQILALYGAKGQISEILKDRNQVQLKDKARNLKLFFLKSNIEVPYYLQCVTGELKTRAPSQAARKEAEERARLASDEEQARFNGIMTLAGGMGSQQPGQQQQGQPNPQAPQMTNSPMQQQQQQQPHQQSQSPMMQGQNSNSSNGQAGDAHQDHHHQQMTGEIGAELLDPVEPKPEMPQQQEVQPEPPRELTYEEVLGQRLKEAVEGHDSMAGLL